jgi:hypothetical protein
MKLNQLQLFLILARWFSMILNGTTQSNKFNPLNFGVLFLHRFMVGYRPSGVQQIITTWQKKNSSKKFEIMELKQGKNECYKL